MGVEIETNRSGSQSVKDWSDTAKERELLHKARANLQDTVHTTLESRSGQHSRLKVTQLPENRDL